MCSRGSTMGTTRMLLKNKQWSPTVQNPGKPFAISAIPKALIPHVGVSADLQGAAKE